MARSLPAPRRPLFGRRRADVRWGYTPGSLRGKVSMTKVTKAIIPAAGLGTRFLPATKAMPKEMLPIVDKPVIQYVVEEIVASGIGDIIIVTGRGKRAIEDHFDRSKDLEDFLKETGKTEKAEEINKIATMANF